MTRLFVPDDALARALGADAVAAALARALPGASILRNGSRGMAWAEPLVEVECGGRRIMYGPVQEADVPGLVAAGLAAGGAHRLRLGDAEAQPFLTRQHRITFRRAGQHAPLDWDAYVRSGGTRGVLAALQAGPAATLDAVSASGLRGRGGAGFPTGTKWRTAAAAAALRRFIVCNADEGDSGTFADRMVMECDPYLLIEGMVIAGFAVGANEGFIYLRSEYPHAIAVMRDAISRAGAHGLLGTGVMGSGFAFSIGLRIGAGAYVCGEETSLLESIEGRAGQVRAKPPLPAISGLFAAPTVINNVLTLAAVPDILADGAEAYAALGFGRSRGTMPVQLAGNVARGGLVEVPFGVTLGELVEGFGGGTASGRPVKAVQVGGPLGAWFPPRLFDTPFDYEAFAAAGGLIGHGGIVVVDDSADMGEFARFAMEFCAVESCGKCTPCRIGSTRGVEVIDRIRAGHHGDVELLRDLCETMKYGSLCALGGFTPYPVLSALEHFPRDFTLPGDAA